MMKLYFGLIIFVACDVSSLVMPTTRIVANRKSVIVGSTKKPLKQFFELATPYFKETSEGKWQLGRVVGLTLLQSGVSVVFSYLSRDFYNALSAKDVSTFGEVLAKFCGALAAGVPVTVFYRYEREMLSVKWRSWLTKDILQKYCANRKFYELENDKEIDNPDQRIAEDAAAFADTSLAFGIVALTSIVDLFSFSTILYSIYPPLFAAIIVYATLGSALTAYVGRELPARNFRSLQSEADFRYGLVRLRENAEAVAFYDGAEGELDEARRRLEGAVDARSSILAGQRNVEFVTVAYRFLVQVLPVAVVAPLYFEGKVELGVVTQSASSFNHVLNDLSAIVNQFESIAAFGAGLKRLNAFVDRIDETDEHEMTPTTAQPRSGLVLQTDGLSVQTPDQSKLLVEDLDLQLAPGQSLLITGASGAGKSSLLRTLADLWPPAAGTVARDANSVFLPQRPYCSLGTLKDQLLYPHTNQTAAGEEKETKVLVEALESVGLSALAELDPTKGLDATRDWASMLSLGEQQRLAFARLVLSRPSLAVLDESTSALGVEDERKMYQLIRNTMPDLALISVGHRPSLLEHHDLRLRLDDDSLGLEDVRAEDREAAARASSLF